jgi:phage terminase large subunit-like protein
MIDHTTDYAKKVVRGDIVTSMLVKKQCEKHLRDIKNHDKYEWHIKRANKVIQFIEMLPDPKTGEPNKLAPFQKFIVGSLYGWLDQFGNRRYQKAYISMARKGGKSLLVSGIALYEFIFGKNPKYGRQIYAAANAKDQARIVWGMVKKQLVAIQKDSDWLKKMAKVTESRFEIYNLEDESMVKPLSKDTSSLDGFEPYVGILDEYHEAKDDKMMEVLESGQIQLLNPLTIIISTAGFHLNGPMYKEYQYLRRVLMNDELNDNYFAFIAEQDNEKEVHNESMWVKSNPLLDVPSQSEIIKRNLRKRLDEGNQKNDLNKIMVKNFNVWQNAGEDGYIKHQDWLACKSDETFNPKGREVFIGIDLSRRDDLTAIGFIYPLENEKYFVDSHVFVGHKGGLQAKSERDKINYEQLVRTDKATLTDTDSGIINDTQVFDWLIDYIESNQLDVQSIMYDPYAAANILVRFEDYHYPLIEVGQGYKNLSEPLKQFKLDVFEKKVIHDGNPNLDIAINNAIVKYDNNGNIILDKKKNREKIDPIVALVTAFTQAMHYDANKNLENYIMSSDFGF